MKKIICLLCSLLSLSFLVFPVNADYGENTSPDIEMETEEYIDPNFISAANGYTINLNARLTSKSLSINQWYQDSGSYGIHDVMKTCTSTIKAKGCALTSVTMVSNYLTGNNRNPAQVNTLLGDSACPIAWYTAASILGISLPVYKTSGLTESYVKNEIMTQININNLPVIIGMTKGSNTHFVVAYGYSHNVSDASTTIYLKNPAVNGATTLAEYYAAGWTVHRLVVYSN